MECVRKIPVAKAADAVPYRRRRHHLYGARRRAERTIAGVA
jgi:hypothetical protein